MKIRKGYVSNSSSSSFTIWYKGELTKENIIKALGVDKDNPLYFFAEDLAKYIIGQTFNPYNKPIETFEKLAKDYDIIGYDEENPDLTEAIKELPDEYKRFQEGFKVLRLNPSYNEYNSPIEGYLGNLNYKVLADTETCYMEVGE